MGQTQEKCSHFGYIHLNESMIHSEGLREDQLAELAKKFRIKANRTRAQAARDFSVSQTSIFNAEESTRQSLFKLRKKMIETYSNCSLSGPLYFLDRS